MSRLTTRISGYAHGAEGISEEKLTGNYCRGEFEATACVEKLCAYEDAEEQGLLIRLPRDMDRSDLIYILLDRLLRTEFGGCYMCENPMKNITLDGVNNGCDGECKYPVGATTDDLLTKILKELEAKAALEKMQEGQNESRTDY